MKTSEIKDWDFDDLVSWVIADLFNALIEGGTKNMKARFFATYNVITHWQAARGIIKE